mmetsp:Transcript_60737/g.157925  ORF Transcript_60737/g.157925 Transcript_60737/m.157925 type:complete len:202 (+) Transcript_60737:126-731(+)
MDASKSFQLGLFCCFSSPPPSASAEDGLLLSEHVEAASTLLCERHSSPGRTVLSFEPLILLPLLPELQPPLVAAAASNFAADGLCVDAAAKGSFGGVAASGRSARRWEIRTGFAAAGKPAATRKSDSPDEVAARSEPWLLGRDISWRSRGAAAAAAAAAPREAQRPRGEVHAHCGCGPRRWGRRRRRRQWRGCLAHRCVVA